MTGDLWTGSFGDSYTKRNMAEDDIAPRRAIWQMLLPRHLTSILEVGANVGMNLEAIGMCSQAELYATEPNAMARGVLEEVLPAHHVTADYAKKINFPDGHVDLVMTCGVLIHVPPDDLLASMREIHRVAKYYILTAEYWAPHEEEIPYRGERNAMWRRDYGGLFLDNFKDLHLESCIFAYKRLTGLDNLTIFLLSKGARPN